MIPPLLAVCLWPLVVAGLFQSARPQVALIVSIVGGFLLLPEQGKIDLPLLPTLDKGTVPSLMALVMAMIVVGRMPKGSYRPGWFPRHVGLNILLFGLIAAAAMTIVTNGDAVSYGPRRLPGLRPYDALSTVLSTLLLVLPLLLARKFLARPEDHYLLLAALMFAGLFYSLPALYEVRMSPQLNRVFYGFFPHSWAQHLRGGGFRPLVFLSHGLILGIFLMMSVVATAGLARVAPRKYRVLLLLAMGFLIGSLVLAKVLGALLITLILLPIVFLVGVRLQLVMAMAIVVVVTAYPLARGAGWIPVEEIHTAAQNYSPQRGASLGLRLRNEDALLTKAQERPWFGWGGWGRSRLYNDEGVDIAIVDGNWIIQIGIGGWMRYLTFFGLLGGAITLLTVGRKKYEIGMETSVLALLVAGNLVDLIPNNGLTPVTMLAVGALWGRVELGRLAPKTQAETDINPSGRRTTRYQRHKPVADPEPEQVAAITTKRSYARDFN